MSYVESTLGKNEQIIYSAKISVWSMWFRLIFVLSCVIGLLNGAFLGLILGSIVLITMVLDYKRTELTLTNKRVVAKFGIISTKVIEIDLNKLESIQIDQSVMGKICDYGSLILSGAGNPKAPIPGISAPMSFRQAYASLKVE